jgi:mutator protein MutT
VSEKTRSKYVAQFINKLHRIYWFVTRPKTRGVKVIIFNSENKILMVRLTYYPNTWTFVGGGVAKDEKPEDAILRECEEEVKIKLQEVDFMKTLDFNHEYKKDTLFVYKAKVDNSDFKIDLREVAEAKWFDLSDLPNMGENAKRILETAI